MKPTTFLLFSTWSGFVVQIAQDCLLKVRIRAKRKDKTSSGRQFSERGARAEPRDDEDERAEDDRQRDAKVAVLGPEEIRAKLDAGVATD